MNKASLLLGANYSNRLIGVGIVKSTGFVKLDVFRVIRIFTRGVEVDFFAKINSLVLQHYHILA